MSRKQDSIPPESGINACRGSSNETRWSRLKELALDVLSALCIVWVALVFVANAWSQITPNTTINLNTQGRNPNFSTFPATWPMTVGAALPSTCVVGQMFFLSTGAAGANLYGCTAANTWTLEGGNNSSASTGSNSSPSVGLSVTSLSFPSQVTGTTSTAQAVTLSNNGTAGLTISGISIAGTNAADFAQQNACGSSLAAGSNCIITVSFTPSLAAAETATLSIADNATGSPQTVSLSGTGVSSSSGTSSSNPVLTPSVLVAKVGSPLAVSADRSVTWSLASGSAGTLSTQSGSSTTFMPPGSIAPQNALAGCMVAPNDSVFNTRIDALPVHASSSTWINSIIANPVSFQFAWGTNVVDNTLTATAQQFRYTPSANASFQIPPTPSRNRETGSLTTDGNNDHHMVSMNRQSCHFYETYQDGDPVANCSGCTAASGLQYDGTNYALPPAGQGSTDAAGLPLEPLMLHLSEIESGTVNHALRFTMCTGCINSGTFLWPATTPNGSNTPSAPPMGARFRLKSSFVTSGVYAIAIVNGGYGYTSAPAVAISGCQTAPVATASLHQDSIGGITLTSNGSGCTNPTVTLSGGGGSGASVAAMFFSPAAQVVLQALQQYGMFLADNGTTGQIQTSTDVTRDPAVVNALNQINAAKIMPSSFDVVDESSLMVSAGSSQVNPANGYVTPLNYAVLTATDGSGNKTSVPIALQPVTVGTPFTSMTFIAGGPAYTLSSWVNGTTNQSVTWTLASGPGTLTSAGVYTPPATVSGLTQAVFKATSAADPTASTNIYATVVPTGANPSGSIRVDVGNSNSYTDSAGNVWLPDAISSEMATFSLQNDNYPSNAWGSIADPALYQTYKYTWGDDLYYGPFIVPNGNYKVNLMFGLGGCSGSYTPGQTFDSGLIEGQLALESQGQIQVRFNPIQAANYACRTPATVSIPAQVANNTLYFAVRATGGVNTHSAPYLNAFSITPDSTPAYLSIDTQQVTSVKSGTTAQMYATGWYMSNSVNWSVSGGGTIDQTGLYTAPASVSSNQTVTITATSIGSPGISATATLTVTP